MGLPPLDSWEIAASASADVSTCFEAMRTLAALRCPIAGRDLERLARRWGLAPLQAREIGIRTDRAEPYAYVLALARGPEQAALAVRWIGGLDHRTRAEVVYRLVFEPTDPAVFWALYDAWFRSADPRRPADREVALATLDDACSRDLLLEEPAALGASRLRDVLAECEPEELATFATRRRWVAFAVHHLAMPASWMVGRYGRAGTLRRAMRAVWGGSRELFLAGVDPSSSARGWIVGERVPRVVHAVRILSELGASAGRFHTIAAHPDLHPLVAQESWRSWSRADPLGALERERAAPGRALLFSYDLRRIAAEPTSGHRAFLAACLDRPERWMRYRAIEGLERLGGDGPGWRIRLERLSADGDEAVRLRALGALAVRGDAVALAALLRVAAGGGCAYARAEAVTWIGAAAPEANEALLVGALLSGEGPSPSAPSFDPLVAAAAIALARVPTREVGKALLQACLKHGCEDVALATGAALRHVALTPEAPPKALCDDPWRRQWVERKR